MHKRNFKVADDDTTEDPADEDFFLAEQNIDDNGCTPLVCSFFETPDLHLYEDQLGETNEDAATDDGTGQVTLYDTVQVLMLPVKSLGDIYISLMMDKNRELASVLNNLDVRKHVTGGKKPEPQN